MSNPDAGYEPWARMNVRRGQGIDVAAARELLDTIDQLRAEVQRLRDDIDLMAIGS